ncbi:MAG: ATPase, T2SS/T4P/T4SS family, partial [Candidatus Methanoperedens sp.]
AMGLKPPVSVSEQDVEKYLAKEKSQMQSSLKELNEAESALKEITLERKEKERELQNLQESIGIKANAEYLVEVSDFLVLKQQDKEKRQINLVQKKKMLAERLELEYRNSLLEIIRKKETELLKPLLLESESQGTGNTILLVKTVFEMLRSSFAEKDITEIPVYDTSRYGEIISFVPPEHFDIVEQSWISEPCALASIIFNKNNRKNLYYVSEPILTPFEEALLKNVNESLKVFLLEEKIDFNLMNKELVLYNNFNKILNIYGIEPDEKSRQKIWYHIKRNYVGYVKLDVLIKDPMIEDISVVGSNTPVYLYHRKYANIETNIIFEDEELNEMILKLAQISGKSISTGYPIINSRLPDGSRLEATLGREVTTHGGTITIRKFREQPFTPTDLIKAGTFNTEIMAHLWLEVENNKSIILVGETASGKTTTLNAISLFIPSESKVISIEDTREITLYHKNWIPGVIRESLMGQEAASIDMFELLRSALRQRPEYLIVGEVRGKEAYTLFQAMSTGHTTYSTMHAGSV